MDFLGGPGRPAVFKRPATSLSKTPLAEQAPREAIMGDQKLTTVSHFEHLGTKTGGAKSMDFNRGLWVAGRSVGRSAGRPQTSSDLTEQNASC